MKTMPVELRGRGKTHPTKLGGELLHMTEADKVVLIMGNAAGTKL